MPNTTRFPSKKSTLRAEATVFLPPIKVPKHVRDSLKVFALDDGRDLTKQVRKVLVDYVNDREDKQS